MGLISGALIAVLTAVGTTATDDLYQNLKSLLGRKSDDDSGLEGAINRLEADPTNAATAATIDAIAAELGLDQDAEVQHVVESINNATNVTATRGDTANVSGVGNKVAMGGSQIIEH